MENVGAPSCAGTPNRPGGGSVSAAEPGRPRRTFPLFDWLRALAAIAVVVYHAGPYLAAGSAEGALAPYFARLNVGVAVFFAISGFLLYRPMLTARVQGRHFSVGTY